MLKGRQQDSVDDADEKKSIITAGLVNQNRLKNHLHLHHHPHHRRHHYNLQWQAGLQSSDSVMAPITRTHNVLHTLSGFLCLPLLGSSTLGTCYTCTSSLN